MPAMGLVAVVLFCFAAVCSQCAAQTASFHSVDQLPDIEIDGEKIKIHTQGLYASETDYIVTGRVDTPPRRPVVLRFSRGDLADYRLLELTLSEEKHAGLNHPGGFDRDENGLFWIPLSTSHRNGPTVVIGMKINDGKLPRHVSEISHRIELPDHIGAICCLDGGRLLGANWDTKTVYVIDTASGEVLDAVSQRNFFGESSGLHLAVQDWKFNEKSKLVIAAGIDKSSGRESATSSAVVAWIDPERRKITSSIRLERREDVARPLTNEGMALYHDQLFLLPEDFGRGAKVLRFDLRVADQSQ